MPTPPKSSQEKVNAEQPPPQHIFHGYAAGFGARLERPFVHQAGEAVTALSSVGGTANAVSRGYQLQDLFAFEEATSSVLGHYVVGRAPVDVTAESRVSASVKGLVVPNVFSADRIAMALVSERDFPESPRRFRVEEARIEGLKIRDQGTFDFDASGIDLGELRPLPGGATQREVQALQKDTPDAQYALDGQTVGKRLALVRSQNVSQHCPPVFTVSKGILTFKIYLFEFLVKHGSIELTMLRVEIHRNPRDGSGAAASGGVNGNPST